MFLKCNILINTIKYCRSKSGSKTVAPNGRNRTPAWTSTVPPFHHRHRAASDPAATVEACSTHTLSHIHHTAPISIISAPTTWVIRTHRHDWGSHRNMTHSMVTCETLFMLPIIINISNDKVLMENQCMWASRSTRRLRRQRSVRRMSSMAQTKVEINYSIKAHLKILHRPPKDTPTIRPIKYAQHMRLSNGWYDENKPKKMPGNNWMRNIYMFVNWPPRNNVIF